MAARKVRKGRSQKRSRAMSGKKMRRSRRPSRGGAFHWRSLTRPIHSWKKSKFKKAIDDLHKKYVYNHKLKEDKKPYFHRWEPTEAEKAEEEALHKKHKYDANLRTFEKVLQRAKFDALKPPTEGQKRSSPYLG